MSRKHILFKRAAISPKTPAYEEQAVLVLAARGIKTTKVETIFSLIDFPDLKLIVSKSVLLQRQLSSHLPQQGCYGFLWSGEQLPDLRTILSTSPFFDICFVFQRTTDPEPNLARTAFSILERQTEVYNWRVFQYGSLSFAFDQLWQIRRSANNEIELDRSFRQFRQSLLPVQSLPFCKGQKAWPESNCFYLNGVLNYLQAVHPGPVEVWNTADKLQNILTASAGDEINFIQTPGVQASPGPLFPAVKEKLLPDFQTAVSGLLSGLRMLLVYNGEQQADLFMDRIELDFYSFWDQEKPRLEAAGLPLKMQKGFAAARFLISKKIVSESPVVLGFLTIALIRTLQKPARKTYVNDFTSQVQSTLTELLSYMSMLDKIQPLLLHRARWSSVSSSEINSSAPSLIFYPLPAYLPKNYKRQVYLNRLFEQPEIIWPDEQEIWHDQIALRGSFYQKLGRYGQALFNHLYARELKEEAVQIFYASKQIYTLLEQRQEAGKEGLRIALVFPYILSYKDAGSTECPLKKIVQEVLAAENWSFDTEHIFEWEEEPSNPEISSIMILKLRTREI